MSVITLETSTLFHQLSPAELEALRQIASEQSFASGKEIFKEGDRGDGIYVVKDGAVEISGLIGPNQRHIFSTVGPGEIFGEMAVIDRKPRSACATAKTDTSVYFIPCEAILGLAERSPGLALGLFREVSSRLREFNHQYVREVIQSERLAIVGRFVRSIVHDLKNPLNIIGITAELAGMENATLEFRQQSHSRILKQVERISDLIGEIMDFTQGGGAQFVLAPGDYAVFAQQTLAELRAEAELKSVKLELENAPPAVELLMDPKRLGRVFHNLVGNATDAMPEGGRIIVRFIDGPKEIVTEVEDTGTGIAPEIAGHLFEAFATYGKTHGTGLGLSICKRVIEDHQGWIAARNGPGGGAIFSFGLPRRDGASTG